jgi:hypothetical protein
MSGVKNKSVKKKQKIVENEFLEDGEMLKYEEKFWEEMNINKEKMKMEVEEQKIRVKEEKPEVKKQCTSLYNKYKRKREDDEDVGDYKIDKRRSPPGYFQYACEFLTNNEKRLHEIYKEYPSIFTRHHKLLEKIVYEQDRLKKRTHLEVTWLFGGKDHGQIEWVDKYLNLYDTIHKVGNYNLGLIVNFTPMRNTQTCFRCSQTSIWSSR